MTTEAERLARAGNYILGMMNDAERERAEHDLEVDDAFRNAVIHVAERMHLFEAPGSDGRSDGWEAVAARLAELPQMRTAPLAEAMTPAPRAPARQAVAWRGRNLALGAVALAAVFALGFAAGRYFPLLMP